MAGKWTFGEMARLTMALTLMLGVASPALAQDPAGAGEAAAPAEETVVEGVADGFYAVVTKYDGPEGETLLVLPDESVVETFKEGDRFQEGTQVVTGDGCTLIMTLQTVKDGKAANNSMISIRPVSEIRLDKLILSDDGAVTRLKIKSGEVRVKVTETRGDYSTDMKIATPNATASVRGTDVNQIGYSAMRGTYASVASGSISSENRRGRVSGIGGGSNLTDNSDSALDQALRDSSNVIAPIGMVEYEVSVGQLAVAGPQRPGSDLNNAGTNPTSGRSATDATGGGGRSDEVDPLP